MKKKNVFIASVFSLAAVIMAGGYALSARAFDNNRSSDRAPFGKFENSSWYQGLTNDQKALLETIKTDQEKQMQSQRTAMDNAIASGNYETWAAAVRQYMGDNAPILTQVTAASFATYADGYRLEQQSQDLMKQAQDKFSSIGLHDMGFGMGMMRRGRGMGHFDMDAFMATSTPQ
ncbi:MAG: hypothetical protein ACM3PZ_02380 [Bacillota bacterium]